MSKPHLLLLHGALGSAAQFEPVIPLLADHFEVYFPDFEGHGHRASDRDFRIEHFADNVLEFLDQHLDQPIDVFGYSMGGYVAALLASTHPQRIGRIMTLGTKWLWTPEAAAKEIRQMDADAIEEKVPHFARMLEARHSALGWREVMSRTRKMIGWLGEDNIVNESSLREINHEVRVVVGDRDATVTVEESTAVYRLLPNAQLQVLPGTPHPLEKVGADRVAALITEWSAPKVS